MSAKSVLIIRCGALGDLVSTTSTIDAMKSEFGEDTIIDFVSTPSNAKLFEKDTRVNKLYPLKHKRIPILLSSDKKNIINISKKTPYDLLINFEFNHHFKTLIDAIHSKKKIGAHIDEINVPIELVQMVEYTKYIFRNVVSKEVYDKSFPRLIGTDKTECKTKYDLNEKYIIISPSNSHQKKNGINYRAWENSSWKDLISQLSLKTQVVIVGNKNEDNFFNKLKPYPKNVVDLVAKTSLVDLIGVIEGATALVSTDTGTSHIASAVNTEVFTLIGPTPANRTGPYQSPYNKVHIISANLECSPCYRTEVMKNCKDNICMKEISPDMVYNSIISANIL